MRACWAAVREKEGSRPWSFRGLGCVFFYPPCFLRAYLVWLGILVPSLYEVIHYILSFSLYENNHHTIIMR
jgi:hypothetical protein